MFGRVLNTPLVYGNFFIILQRIDLMNSVNSVVQNFEFMSYKKKGLLLFGDSRFDENKNKVTLEVTITFIKSLKDLLDIYLNNIFNACFCPILNL